MSKTVHHLSHTDLDGYSAQLIMKYTPYSMSYYNANYGAEVGERISQILEAIKEQKNDATILISDLNLTMDEAKSLNKEVDRINETSKMSVTILLLDHHGSGEDCAKKFEWYYLDTHRCATKIVYDYVKVNFEFDEPTWMCEYVNAVNAVDLWKQEEVENFEYGKVCMRLIYETRELNRVMFASSDHEYKTQLLINAAQMINHDNANIALDESIHRMKKEFFKVDKDDTLDNLATNKIVKLLSEQKANNTIYYKNYKGYMSYGVGNTSIVGNGFLVANDDYDFIVDVSSRGTMGFRANNKVDVSLIAKELGNGGGHPNASGGRMQGFKEQFRYDKAKAQVLNAIDKAEATAGKLEFKKETLS